VIYIDHNVVMTIWSQSAHLYALRNLWAAGNRTIDHTPSGIT
jgi:hypothetical protein